MEMIDKMIECNIPPGSICRKIVTNNNQNDTYPLSYIECDISSLFHYRTFFYFFREASSNDSIIRPATASTVINEA